MCMYIFIQANACIVKQYVTNITFLLPVSNKWKCLLDGRKYHYEREKILFTLQTRGRQVKDIPYSSPNRLNVDATVWATISSVVLWNIWIGRCQNVFQQIKQNHVHCVKEIWSMLISMLKG